MNTRQLTVLSTSGLLALAVLSPAALASPEEGPAGGERGQVASAAPGRPSGANPYLAFLPAAAVPDYAAWSTYLAGQAGVRDDRRASQYAGNLPEPLVVEELEPAGTRGQNDTLESAEQLEEVGTGPGDRPAARVLGSLTNEPVWHEPIAQSAEDDGSIPLARDTGIGTAIDAVSTTGTIGDGPHGSAGTGSGDFDVYRIHGLAGQRLTVATQTPTGELDTLLILFDAAGEVVDFNLDAPSGDTPDSLLTYTVPDDGDYYAYVTGGNGPDDPFDSGSGQGWITEGTYEVRLSQQEVDTDMFAVSLRQGDVVGLSLAGAGTTVGIFEPDGTLVQGSEQDTSALYPMQSPLPGGGRAVSDHVVDVDGWHYLAVRGDDGVYELTAEIYRPALEEGGEQTLFLDFDGARLNTALWGGPGVRQLSPFESFLGNWGLTEADYQPLARKVIATVQQDLGDQLAANGDEHGVRIRNSLDHRDPFGDDNVSRVIIGGTIEESGVATIGIAQSIDPGNFATEETALVLLDVLSSTEPDWPDSLNAYLTEDSDRIDFIGRAIGSVVSHEAGHFLGNWHVDPYSELNVMDSGGNFELFFGVGPDGVGGTEDDQDATFGEDVYDRSQGFTGIEDTRSRLAYALLDD